MTQSRLEPLSEELEELLVLERSFPDPSDLVKQRVHAGVLTQVSLPPTSSADAASDAISSSGEASVLGSGTITGGLVKGVLIFAVGAASGAGVQAYLGERQSAESKPPGQQIQEAAVAAPSPTPETVEETPGTTKLKKSVRPTRHKVPAAARPTPDRDADLAVERSLLQRARMALARDDAKGALLALKQHADGFPAGTLVEERLALMITALVRDGQHAEARMRAAEFHEKFPRSMLRGSVDAAISAADAF